MLTIRNLLLCVLVPVAAIVLLQRYPETLRMILDMVPAREAAPQLR
jgi:hypothetical protein